MNDIDHQPAHPVPGAQPEHHDADAQPAGPYADEVGRRILENPELVRRILESEQNMSAPMSVREFRAWLDRVGDEAAPSGE